MSDINRGGEDSGSVGRQAFVACTEIEKESVFALELDYLNAEGLSECTCNYVPAQTKNANNSLLINCNKDLQFTIIFRNICKRINKKCGLNQRPSDSAGSYIMVWV